MKNIAALMLSIALVVAVGFGVSSCKDDEPPVPPKLGFAETEITVNEDDGNLEVQVVLDKAHSKDLRIEYELGGTANDQDNVGDTNADYEVVGEHGVVEIEAGQTVGIITLNIYADAVFESNETIEIAIVDTNTDEIQLTADDEVVITITNDDAQLVASFASATMTIKESDGVQISGNNLLLVPVNIPIQLDNPAPAEIILNYSIKIDLDDQSRFDAIDSTWAVQNDIPLFYYDYSVIGTRGEVRVPAGATSANIALRVRTDFSFDPGEEIEITLEPSSAVQIGTNKTVVVTIDEQDGKLITLVWDGSYTDVDMDMFLSVGDDTTSFDLIVGLSTIPSVEFKAEFVHIPSVFADGAFGLSYVYYEGTQEPMEFQVRFVDFVDNQEEAPEDWDTFDGTYTLANINEWTNEETGVYPPVIAQRFVIADGVFAYGALQEPSSSSRTRPTTAERPARISNVRPNTMTGAPFGKYRSSRR